MAVEKEWTIMVYMSGDNNLSVEMAYALESIKNAAEQCEKKAGLLVYYDGSSRSVPTLYCDFSDSENPRYIPSQTIENKKYDAKEILNEDSSQEESVLNFVDWCVNKAEHSDGQKGHKAHRYMLIFSGHSFGFQSIGLLKDEFTGHSMSMSGMEYFLEEINKNIIGQKIDILGFDSCVMSMLEVGYQFRSYAKTLIASEGSVPSSGWTYAEILGKLAHSPKHEKTTDIAAEFVRQFIEKENSYTIGNSAVDMAAWDLSKMEGINQPFARLCNHLLDCFQDENSTIYKQMKRVVGQVHRNCQSYMLNQNLDLGDFCELLQAEVLSLQEELKVDSSENDLLNLIRNACEDILAWLKECVLLSGFSGGDYQFSNGISLFFPWSMSAFNVSRNDYRKLHFIKETDAGKSWNKLLKKYLGEVAFRKRNMKELVQSNWVWNDSIQSYVGFANAVKMADNASNKMADNASNKMADNASNKMADNVSNKMADNASNKMADNVSNKMADNASNKMADNASNKMADNVSNKMGGSFGRYFEVFSHLDNTETTWNISGFTKPKEHKS